MVNKINFLFLILLWYGLSNAKTFVKLSFYDTAEVNDTFFTVGDVAVVTCLDSILSQKIRECFAGRSAPPGYVRPVSISDVVNYFLKNRFSDINFTCNSKDFVYVKTASIETEINFFRKEIISYIEKQVRWKESDWKVDLINGNEKVSYLKKPYTVEIKGMDDSYPRGNTNLTLIIKQKGYTRKVGVRCRFTVNTEVAIAAKEISRGSIITREDFVMKKVDITNLAQIPILDPGLLVNKRIVCTIKQGIILNKRMVGDIPAIEKGDEINIILKNNGVTVSVPAISRENGSIGDYIWVENTITHRLIRARVEKKGLVMVKKGGV